MGVVAVVGLVAAPPLGAAEAPGGRPNVVFILADDLGYGDLSCYGGKDLRTPNLDALAAAGARWSQFYASCPVCSPTRAALLTGRYPDHAGVPGVIRTHPENSWGYLRTDVELLPAVLKKAGYATALVGKWHLGLEAPNLPNLRGFDHFHGWLGDMMDDYVKHRRHNINYMRLEDKEIDPEGHATDLFTGWAIEWIKARAADKTKPFFLYLAYNAPHGPIQPPAAWLEKVQQRQPGVDPKRAKLVALIEHLDDGVGKVVAALKEAGVAENTLVVFTSDNGGDLPAGATNGPLRGGKTEVYEGGLRVPMVAAWPGKIAAGSKCGRAAVTMDFFPTICEAAGVTPPAGIDAVSLLASLRQGDAAPALPERDLYWVRREGGPMMGLTNEALRRGDWKIVHNAPNKPFELYNLKDDPQETTDLAQKNRPKFNELSAALRLAVQRGGRVPWQPPEGLKRD